MVDEIDYKLLYEKLVKEYASLKSEYCRNLSTIHRLQCDLLFENIDDRKDSPTFGIKRF